MKKFKIIWWRIKSVWAIYRFGHPSKKIKVIGVTGTNGKTTTATLLYQIATRLGFKAGLISTVENIIGDKKIGATHTTPDSVSLTRLLSEMVDMGCEYAFMEVSSHALDQNRVWGINFSGGIFSNLTHDHLDYHKTIENYFQAKKKFFKLLSQNAFALSNTDDEQGASMLLGIKARKFSYGFSGGENFHGQVKKIDYSGLQLIFNEQEINSQLLGKFNASNLLAVWSVCKLLDFDMQKVKNILKDIKPPRGRFEHFKSQNDVLIIVDYAHTPDALEKVFSAVNEIRQPDGRIISVFGCGGDRDPIKRPIMGKIGAT
ncbi:UDP-N-acetylmuramoyl-L-alanyl-D-glutamate--2,6-diaminopimelate ligase, partial [Candidatus Nomurabacteria bacterium CG10_big_fil_rev_8_21_14_0_10_35_16]